VSSIPPQLQELVAEQGGTLVGGGLSLHDSHLLAAGSTVSIKAPSAAALSLFGLKASDPGHLGAGVFWRWSRGRKEATDGGRWHLPACALPGCTFQKPLPVPARTSEGSWPVAGVGGVPGETGMCRHPDGVQQTGAPVGPSELAWPDAPPAVLPSVRLSGSASPAPAAGPALDSLLSWAGAGSRPFAKNRGGATRRAQGVGMGTRCMLRSWPHLLSPATATGCSHHTGTHVAGSLKTRSLGSTSTSEEHHHYSSAADGMVWI